MTLKNEYNRIHRNRHSTLFYHTLLGSTCLHSRSNHVCSFLQLTKHTCHSFIAAYLRLHAHMTHTRAHWHTHKLASSRPFAVRFLHLFYLLLFFILLILFTAVVEPLYSFFSLSSEFRKIPLKL